MWEIAIPAVAGLISGAMGSLFAPWANWGVEKKRLQQTARAKLLEEIRIVLLSPPPSEAFRQLPIYSRIRPYLSDDAKKAVDGTFHGIGEESVLIVTGGRHSGVNPYAQQVLDELTSLEKKWFLI